MIKNYNIYDADSVYALAKYYKEKNLSTAYILPMVGLSSFDFHGHLVDTYIDLKGHSVYAKCTNPLYSLTDNINLAHYFKATNNEETEVYYYLQFEIPDDYKKYYDFFLENKLNKFDPISSEILRVNKICTLKNGVSEYRHYAISLTNPDLEDVKKNDVINELIYNLQANITEEEDILYQRPLFTIRWNQIKELGIMKKDEFKDKVLSGEIDLSQKIDFDKLDIEKELETYHQVSVYNPEGVYIYQ